jgi:hypothetical protein
MQMILTVDNFNDYDYIFHAGVETILGGDVGRAWRS